MTCDHCGDVCPNDQISENDHFFCCHGCKTVYSILQAHDLSTYYDLEARPGIRMDDTNTGSRYEYLDDQIHSKEFVEFQDDVYTKVVFSVPQIHCSSCIWLLENLGKLTSGVVHSSVNFSNKKAHITIKHQEISLRELAELLHAIGYAPDLQANTSSPSPRASKTLIIKIGIAGFCFGNIMLLAFPEYLGMDASFSGFSKFFGYVTFLLCLPVILYAGTDYLRNAYNGIRQRYINMDIPIAIGMLVLFFRSSYEVFSGTGSGYFDSLAGLVFFLLIGKWFQQKTYDALAFDRDYTSYFPIVVRRLTGKTKENIKIEELQVGDILELRNGELIPADSILVSGSALIDYSFVTGESLPQPKQEGELIYAGGRQVGTKITVRTTNEVNNSYLTRLWNQELFQKEQKTDSLSQLSNKVSRYFTYAVLGITLTTAAYWLVMEPGITWNAVTAVLIVACPCALALSIPFTLGNATRMLGRAGLYIKSAESIEKLADIDNVVFDKTGTITHKGHMTIAFEGSQLGDHQKSLIRAAAAQSIHPLSMAIAEHLQDYPEMDLIDFQEIPGQGVHASTREHQIKLGSNEFLGQSLDPQGYSCVHVEIDGVYLGFYQFQQHFRSGLKAAMEDLKQHYQLGLLSGDQHSSPAYFKERFQLDHVAFDQSPHEKLDHIRSMQENDAQVLMIGDGLNDAGALKQSDFGIAVSDNVHQFSPACDAILDADSFRKLPAFLEYAKGSRRVIYMSFLFSFLYNIVGLWFAVQGNLSPIVAAILMPTSSITIVVFSTAATTFLAKKRFGI